MATEEQSHEIEPDPRESLFELPPIEGRPFADDDEKVRAIRRVIEQAHRERAAVDRPS